MEFRPVDRSIVYSLVDLNEIMENLVVLTSAECSSPPRNLDELRRVYRQRILADRYVHDDSDDEPRFIGGGADLERLCRGFDLPQRRNDDTVPAPAWRLAKAVSGWRRLREKDEKLGIIAASVIGTIFVTGADWNGSMSDSKHLGTLWLMPGRDWHLEEVMEAYLHELTHTLLFLDERRYGHFLPAAADVRVRSAIRRDVREYPAVVHSALVAAELLEWRSRHQTPDDACRRLHGPTEELMTRALDAHAQVVAEDRRRGLLTARMRELVGRAGDRIHNHAAAPA